MQTNTNKWETTKKIIYILAIVILAGVIIYKIGGHTTETKQSQMQILVDKQKNNLEIIGVKLEAQKELRVQISDLQSKLDANVAEVKEIEAINRQIRDEMLKDANNLSLTWSNE